MRTPVRTSSLLPQERMTPQSRRRRQQHSKQVSEAKQPVAVLVPVPVQRAALAKARQRAAQWRHSMQCQQLRRRLRRRQLPVAPRQTAVRFSSQEANVTKLHKAEAPFCRLG